MIYQSFWSKPFLNPYEDSFETRFQGGFPRYRYFFYTWALSTCRLKDHYGQVHLVTDKKGKEILIDNLKLPFSSVDLLLDDIEDFPSYMWAAGKCYFYSKINKPFIHFDGDFILGNNFGTYDIFDKITNNILVEFFYSDIYSNIYTKILSDMYFKDQIILPNELKIFIDKENFNMSYYNLGVVGSNDWQSFQNIGRESINFIKNNIDEFPKSKLPIDFYNLFCEQYILYYYTKKLNLGVYPINIYPMYNLCEEDNPASILNTETDEFDYVHLAGLLKLSHYKTAENWLKLFYPKEYDTINKALGL